MENVQKNFYKNINNGNKTIIWYYEDLTTLIMNQHDVEIETRTIIEIVR